MNLCGVDQKALSKVITDVVLKIIKARAARIYYEHCLNTEPVRWSLLDGDGNGKGDGSVIAENIDEYNNATSSSQSEEKNRVSKLAMQIMEDNIFKTTTDNGELYRFNSKIYIPNQEWFVRQQCRLIEANVGNHVISEVTSYIKDKTYIDRSEFDNNPFELCLKNGILNIHTLQLRDFSSDDLMLVQLPLTYNPNARCPKINRFLCQVLKRKDILTVLELFGYCLYRSARYEKAVLCIGKGSNGKGTFLKIIERFLGPANVSHASLQDLGGDRFASAGLYGKLANTFADLKSDKLASTGNFKMLVSGDYIRAQNKFQHPFEFQNYAKMFFSANEIPQSDDKSFAYFRRWMILFFEQVFEGDKNDTNLIDKLTTEQELSGLLNLALFGLRRLLEDNEFVNTDDIATVERQYNLNASTVQKFVAEKCDITNDREDYIICRDLWAVYVKFCNENELTSKDDNIFGMELGQLHVKKERKHIKGTREHCYVGIKLRQEMGVSGW